MGMGNGGGEMLSRGGYRVGYIGAIVGYIGCDMDRVIIWGYSGL